MTFTLVRKLLRDIRWPLLIVMLLLAAFQCLFVKITQRTVVELSPFFSTIAARAGVLQKDIENVIFGGPGKIAQTLVGGETIHFERAMDVLSIGYVHPLMQVIFGVWAIGRAASAVAGELDRGTLELLLAQPLPRWRVIAAHLAVDAIVIPLLCLSLWAGTAIGYRLVGPFQVGPDELARVAKLPFKVEVNPELLQIDVSAFGPGLWNVGALLFAVSGVTMAFSAAGRFRSRVIGVSVLVMLVMFLINVVGQMWDAAGWLRPFTVFYYFQPQQVILSGKWWVDPGPVWTGGPLVHLNMLAVLFGVGASGYAIALWTFSRRDLPAPL
jgi:ABC-2 type transport system permease protein